MNACTLLPEYLAKDDDARAADELLCTKMNADAAAYCSELNQRCAGELRRRVAAGSTGQ